MREVSGCDFCGGTASGTFEVLPAEYDPDGTGKRMLLCDHCRDALSSILDPLLDATAGTGRSAVATSETEGSVASDGSADDEPAAGDAGTASEDAAGGTDDAAGPPGSGEPSPASGEEMGAETRMAATGAGSSSRVPRGYRKVLRFLENREFPVDRREAVEMTADAYGMEAEAVDAAIDHAVTHDRLKAYDGELREA